MEVKVRVDSIDGLGSPVLLRHGIGQTLGRLLHRLAAHFEEFLRKAFLFPIVDALGLGASARRGHHLPPEGLIPEEWSDESWLGSLQTGICGTSTAVMNHTRHMIKQPRMGHPADDKGKIVCFDVVAFGLGSNFPYPLLLFDCAFLFLFFFPSTLNLKSQLYVYVVP